MDLNWSGSHLIRKPHLSLKRGVRMALDLFIQDLWWHISFATMSCPGPVNLNMICSLPSLWAWTKIAFWLFFYGHQSSWFFASVPIFVADHTCVLLFKYWCVLLITCVRFLRRCRPTAVSLDWVCCTFFLMTFCLSLGITFRVCIPVSTFIMPLRDLVVKPCPHFYIISII